MASHPCQGREWLPLVTVTIPAAPHGFWWRSPDANSNLTAYASLQCCERLVTPAPQSLQKAKWNDCACRPTEPKLSWRHAHCNVPGAQNNANKWQTASCPNAASFVAFYRHAWDSSLHTPGRRQWHPYTQSQCLRDALTCPDQPCWSPKALECPIVGYHILQSPGALCWLQHHSSSECASIRGFTLFYEKPIIKLL